MTPRLPHLPRLARFTRDERGSTLVEFAIVFVLFLVFLFGLIDFGRMAYNFVVADKAMQVAARIAAVRPPACADVPEINGRGSLIGTPPYRFGTSCGEARGICFEPADAVVTCEGNAANATAAEIWSVIGGALPSDARIDHLRFSYTFNPDLGFLGGPYTPDVTVELAGTAPGDEQLRFAFIHPLAGLLSMSGAGTSPGALTSIPFPSMSVSLPGEDLAHGGGA
jgi:hypothetical protein